MQVKRGKATLSKVEKYTDTQSYVERYNCEIIEKNDENYTEILIRVLSAVFYNVYDTVESPCGGITDKEEWKIYPNISLENAIKNEFGATSYQFTEALITI